MVVERTGRCFFCKCALEKGLLSFIGESLGTVNFDVPILLKTAPVRFDPDIIVEVELLHQRLKTMKFMTKLRKPVRILKVFGESVTQIIATTLIYFVIGVLLSLPWKKFSRIFPPKISS